MVQGKKSGEIFYSNRGQNAYKNLLQLCFFGIMVLITRSSDNRGNLLLDRGVISIIALGSMNKVVELLAYNN